jgi:hypothetical protein
VANAQRKTQGRWIVILTVDALVNAGDDRFPGKALGARRDHDRLLDGVPARVPRREAVAELSVVIRQPWWDHIPHFHGPGALSAVLNELAFGLVGMLAYTVLCRRLAFTRRRRAKPDRR